MKLKQNEKNLMRRYLIWCYKTTKESLDRIDRYFTQQTVDEFLLDDLRNDKAYGSSKKTDPYKKMVDDFKKYMDKKQENVLSKKFCDKAHKKLQPDYQYLKNRFAAIEKAICYFFSEKELKRITDQYEEEMTRRILEAREHS